MYVLKLALENIKNKKWTGLKKEVAVKVENLNNLLSIVTRTGLSISKIIWDLSNISYTLNMVCPPHPNKGCRKKYSTNKGWSPLQI